MVISFFRGDVIQTVSTFVNVTNNITSVSEIQDVATQQLQQYFMTVYLFIHLFIYDTSVGPHSRRTPA